MNILVETLMRYAFVDTFYESDSLIPTCRCCGEKAWLVEDINHTPRCRVARALNVASILDDGTQSPAVRRLKTKILSISKKLEQYNVYGAKYHIKDINFVVEELRELSKALQ